MDRWNETDDAHSCGPKPLRVPLDPSYDLYDIRDTLNFFFTGGDELKAVCEVL